MAQPGKPFVFLPRTISRTRVSPHQVASFLAVRVATTVTAVGLRANSPLLVAIGWTIAARKSPKIPKKSGPGRRTLFVLKKSGGSEDVESALSESGSSFDVYFVPRSIIFQSATHFLKRQVSDTGYRSSDPVVAGLKHDYRQHLGKVLFWFCQWFPRSAFLQFNITYFAERELAAACSEKGIPFAALHKEALWSEGTFEPAVQFFRDQVGTYSGSHLAVYNSMTKKVFQAAGVFSEENIHVVGCSRLDVSHRQRADAADRNRSNKLVVYYLIDPRAGLPRFRSEESATWTTGAVDSDANPLTWHPLITKVNEALISWANDHPECQIVCKTKIGHEKIQKNQLNSSSPNGWLPKNISVVSGGVGHELLSAATAVVGFNSTAVLEAVAAGLPTIVPHIFSEEISSLAPYAHDVTAGSNVVSSVTGLTEALTQATAVSRANAVLTRGQTQILDEQLGNSDGQAGKRLADFLESLFIA